jgi:uncharacterized membrane protein
MRKLLLLFGGNCIAYVVMQFLFPTKANAWFDVCNRSNDSAYVVFKSLVTNDNRVTTGPYANQSTLWSTEGWYTVNSGGCARVYPHELWRRNRYYYVYVESRNGRLKWGGGHLSCIANRRFTFYGSNCWTPSGYASDGYVRGFAEVDIGGGRTQNYTYSFK